MFQQNYKKIAKTLKSFLKLLVKMNILWYNELLFDGRYKVNLEIVTTPNGAELTSIKYQGEL